MESFSSFVSQHVPWLWGLLAWSLAILLLLAVAAIPAYFIFYPIATNVRRGIGSYLSRMFSRHATARETRRQSQDALVEDFRCNSGITYLSERSTRLEAALASFSEIARALKHQFDRLLDVPRAFERISKGLTDAASKRAPLFPNIPTADQISAQHGSLRTAWARLVVSSVFLIALISVNTGMLGQILRELGFIPHDLVYAGIPLYLVFAFILTLVETGLGFVHTASGPSPDEPPRVAVWPVIAVGLALVIACVEGFFYSQVAPIKKSLVDLPIGFSMKQETLFFLWGAALVLALFALGMIWYTSLERLTRSADHFPALVRTLSKHEEKFATAAESAAQAAARLKEEAEAARQLIQGAAQEATAVVASVAQLKDAVSGILPEAIKPRPLMTAEAYHYIYVSGAWLLLAVLVAVIVSSTGFYAVGYTFPYLSSAGASFVGLGLAACFVVLGMLLPRGELLLDGSGTRRLIVSGSLWRGKTALALTVVVVAAFLSLIWRVRTARYQAVLWIVILAVGGSLVAAASQASATGKGLRPWFRLCASFLIAFIEAIGRVGGRLLLAVVYCGEVLALAFAAPVFLLRGHGLPPLDAGRDTRPPRLPAHSAS